MAEIAPYVFWPCDEGAGDTITSQGNYSIALNKVGGDPWANTGELTLDGSSYFDITWDNLTSAQQSFFTIGEGIAAMWCEIELVSTDDYTGAGSRLIPFCVGSNTGSTSLSELRVDYPPNALRARTRDGSTFKDLNGNTLTSDLRRVFMVVFDNRVGRKQAWFYRSKYQLNGNVDLTTIGSISPTTGDYIRIGGGVGSTGSLEFPFFSRLKNVGFMNFGETIPRGIDKYLQDLLGNNGVPQELR